MGTAGSSSGRAAAFYGGKLRVQVPPGRSKPISYFAIFVSWACPESTWYVEAVLLDASGSGVKIPNQTNDTLSNLDAEYAALCAEYSLVTV